MVTKQVYTDDDYSYEICDSDDVVCPYCKYKKQYSGDSLGDGEETEEYCGNCSKKYIVVASVSVSHHCYKKGGLNSSQD